MRKNAVLNLSLSTGLVLAMAGLLSGCATPAGDRDAAMADQVERCHFDETWSCVERMGHPERCFCADKDTLRELLEPTVR